MSDRDITGAPAGREWTEPYDAAACRVCGECLVQCPVLRLGRNAAVREMKALRAGRMGRHVVRRCESCMACNFTCPNHANPAMLFLDTFHRRLEERGAPACSDYFQPHEQKNFRGFVLSHMHADEQRLIEKWTDTSPCEEFVYPGCNIITSAYLARAWFLKDLNIRGALDLCCGEMYFRTGMFEHLEVQARKLNEFVARLGAKRMMILCTAGYNLFTNILPRYGLDAGLEVRPYLPWLWERIDSGDIPVKKPLNMSVTIQDSCHAKVFGPDYWELPRRILERLGARVIEMPHNTDCNWCCGIGGGFPAGSGYNPVDIARATLRVTHEAARAGADAIVTYCAGCLMSLSSGMTVYPAAKPIYHLFQAVQAASGEAPDLAQNRKRGALLFRGVIQNQLPLLLKPGRRMVCESKHKNS